MTQQSDAISPDVFRSLIGGCARDLLSRAAYVKQARGGDACFTRPLLSGILCRAAELEELLDAYGAPRNRRWYPMRRLVAAAKLFSTVSYGLRHLLLFLPQYRLAPADHDFADATRGALGTVCTILRRSLEALLDEARELGLPVPDEALPAEAVGEELPPGRLDPDRQSKRVASPERTVTAVATAFLNLAEDAAFIHVTQESCREDHAEWIPDPVNEARLRDLEERFHSLQSLYDTHISDTNVESLDAGLPVLRGHVSVIYHLLQAATGLTHYCERHILSFSAGEGTEGAPAGATPASARGEPAALVADHREVLDLLLGYALAFSSGYIQAARGLCHEMLRRYAIQGDISVPIPRYRGFHVRPSTMVARIVGHYGSEVAMSLEEERYNAGYTLDLFRANEKINAVKRRLLAGEVQSSLAAEPPPEGCDAQALVRVVAQRLYAQRKLVLYDRSLGLEGFEERTGEDPVELAARALIRMLTMGKIDVEMEIMVTFHGDRRVLEDIKLLAESGYGEDDFGNNLPLPARLAYLRK